MGTASEDELTSWQRRYIVLSNIEKSEVLRGTWINQRGIKTVAVQNWDRRDGDGALLNENDPNYIAEKTRSSYAHTPLFPFLNFPLFRSKLLVSVCYADYEAICWSASR